MWWSTPVTSALGRWRQENHEFQACWATQRDFVSKTKKIKDWLKVASDV
jgi:hypothetical protein